MKVRRFIKNNVSRRASRDESYCWPRPTRVDSSNPPELRVGADGLLEGGLLVRGEVGGELGAGAAPLGQPLGGEQFMAGVATTRGRRRA